LATLAGPSSHLVMDVIDRVPGPSHRAAGLRQRMTDERLRHRAHTRRVGDDPPNVRDWVWPGTPVTSGRARSPAESR